MRAFLLALCISVGFLGVIVTAVRRRAIRDQMALLWLTVSLVMLVLSLTLPFHVLDHLAHLVGVAYGSDLILLAAVIFLVLLVFQLSVAVARLSARTTRLAQDLGMLRLDQHGSGADRASPPPAAEFPGPLPAGQRDGGSAASPGPTPTAPRS